MADSLRIARLFELLGGGVASQLPQCAGARFRLGDAYNFGTPQPVVDFVITMMGDGERPTGHRMSNRSMEIPITIQVPTTGDPVADRLTLSGAREALFEAINTERFELVWSPDGTNGTRDTVFDCWRAKASTVDFNYKAEKQLTMTVTVAFDAYPWGRSDTAALVAFDSPILTAANTPVYQLNDTSGGSSGATVTGSNSGATLTAPYNTAWTTVTIGGGATLIYLADQSAHGTQSILTLSGASNTPAYTTWTSPYTSSATQWFRSYVYLTGNPNTPCVIVQALTGGAAVAGSVKINANGTVSMDAGASASVITTVSPLPLNQWVRLEGFITGDTTIGQVGLSVFPAMDSAIPAESLASAATFNTVSLPASWRFGIISGGNTNYNYHYDDPAISGTGLIGPYQAFGAGGGYLPAVDVDRFDAVSSNNEQRLWWRRSSTTAANSYSALWFRDITDLASPATYERDLYDPGQASGFEVNTEGWTALPQTAVARSTAQHHAGVAALSITASGTPAAVAGAASGFLMTCTQGDTLTVSAWVRSAVTARTVEVDINFFTQDNTFVTSSVVGSGTDSAAGWTLISGTVTVPYGGALIGYGQVIVSVISPAAGEVHYTDDAGFTRGAWVDIRGRDKLAFWLGLGVDSYNYRAWHGGTMHFAVTLTDINGTNKTFGFQATVRASNNQSWPFWNQLSLKIPQTGTTFRFDRITGYTVKAWTEQKITRNGLVLHMRAAAYLAGLRATPTAAPKRPSSGRGGDYVLYGIEGTAPTPLSLHCQLGFQNFVATTQRFNLPGNPGQALAFTAPPENPNWLSGDSANFDASGTTGTWTGSDGLATNALLTNSVTLFASGVASMRVAPSAGGSNATFASNPTSGILSAGTPCVAGDRISLRVNVRAGTTVRAITVGAEFFNAAGASVGRVNLSPVTDSAASFTLISGRVTAPAAAVVCRAIITIATPAAGEFHYFDDCYLAWALQALVMGLGGGGGGGSVKPTKTAGGGGGAGEIAWETNLDLVPGGAHAYTIGAGGQSDYVNGSAGSGGATTFTGLSVVVTAHGGAGGQQRLVTDHSSGTGGAGGSGSGNGHHFNGAAGATGSHLTQQGGGGGGAGGDGGAGSAGGTPTGGPGGAAGALGQGGGRGGDGQNSGGGTGADGYWTGGGGGGAAGNTVAYRGGAGGDGKITIIITTYTAAAAFPTLLIHKPDPRSTTITKTVVPVGSGQDLPDGREYQLGVVDGFYPRYDGTYTVYAVNFSWNGATARTVTATLRQYEAAGGAVSVASVSQSVTPANVLNGMVNLGEVTLPVKDMPPDNTDSYFTAAVTSANTADRFLDLLLVDSSGSTILINLPGGTGYTDYWVDAPAIGGGASVGRVIGSVQDRAQAVSVLSNTDMSGGPLELVPGINQFTIYSPQGQPGLEGEYIPHWWLERLY